MQRIGKAIDQVRAAEVKQLRDDSYEPGLTGSRWVLLKRPENLTEKQAVKLAELLQYHLTSIRAHLMKEDFQRFWEYQLAGWAGKFLDPWCNRAMRSRIEPMKKVAGMLRDNRNLVLNWFRAEGKLSGGIVEGFSNKLKRTTRTSCGFRTQEAWEIALYHNLGALPEARLTHEFCGRGFCSLLFFGLVWFSNGRPARAAIPPQPVREAEGGMRAITHPLQSLDSPSRGCLRRSHDSEGRATV